MKLLKEERTGITKLNKFGSKMSVEQYNVAKDIIVRFVEHGNLVHTSWGAFCKGEVKNVYDKSVCGIGYIGDGKYRINKNGKYSVKYITWYTMIQRCYDENTLEKYPTYKGCIVNDEWLNFQTFAEWYDNNYYEVENQKMVLDKDILVKGNKIYSPETCVFVPELINLLFTKSNAKRGNFPIGVYMERNKYKAQCSNGNGKQIFLGYYNTPYEAFQSYKNHKEKLIKKITYEYKNSIPPKLFKALLSYEVDIDD